MQFSLILCVHFTIISPCVRDNCMTIQSKLKYKSGFRQTHSAENNTTTNQLWHTNLSTTLQTDLTYTDQRGRYAAKRQIYHNVVKLSGLPLNVENEIPGLSTDYVRKYSVTVSDVTSMVSGNFCRLHRHYDLYTYMFQIKNKDAII